MGGTEQFKLVMNIQKELEYKLEEFKSFELAKKYIIKIEKDIKAKHVMLQQLYVRLEEECEDVEKLEKMSVRAIFENILVDKEKQLEKERQEYLNAVLSYNECKKHLELLSYERKIIKNKLKNYDKIKSELHALSRKREQTLMQEYPVAHQLISDINKRLDDLISYKKELQEVIIIGVKANLELEKTMESLEQVIPWGEFIMNQPDLEFDNKIFINKASDHAINAKKILEHFEYELIDVYGDQNRPIQSYLERFNCFIDIFLKNLIVDWVLFRKIKEARYPFHQMNLEVKNIIKILNSDLKELGIKQEALMAKKEKIIQELN